MGKPRGFAAMDRAKVREIASKGGKKAHEAGTAHRFTSEEAAIAGKKGGNAPHKRRGAQKVEAVIGTKPEVPQFEESYIDGSVCN